jgi:hypothetical protein
MLDHTPFLFYLAIKSIVNPFAKKSMPVCGILLWKSCKNGGFDYLQFSSKIMKKGDCKMVGIPVKSVLYRIVPGKGQKK